MGASSSLDHPTIFFDGVCNLCNSSINFVIDRDSKAIIKFVPLQSNTAKGLLPKHNIDPEKLDGIVFYDGEKIYQKSRAVLEITTRMRGIWPLCYGLIIIPGFVRNLVYDFIAKNRYRWFGKQSACRVPTPELKSRFLD